MCCGELDMAWLAGCIGPNAYEWTFVVEKMGILEVDKYEGHLDYDCGDKRGMHGQIFVHSQNK